MKKLYTFDLGSHHVVVMDYADAQATVPACIMETFTSDLSESTGSTGWLAVCEDRHALDCGDYTYDDLEEYIEEEAKKINLELSLVERYPRLMYMATFKVTIGLMSHYFHECIGPYCINSNYINELKKLGWSSPNEDIRHGIIDAFNYAHLHMPAVMNVTDWYYEKD